MAQAITSHTPRESAAATASRRGKLRNTFGHSSGSGLYELARIIVRPATRTLCYNVTHLSASAMQSFGIVFSETAQLTVRLATCMLHFEAERLCQYGAQMERTSTGMTANLDGRVAVVTGASSGLGQHFARVLAANGASIALAARRIDRLEMIAEEIGKAGGRAVAVEMDVTDEASVKSGFSTAMQALGPIGIVVNNAGVPSSGMAVDVTDEQWRSVMAVNLDGVFRVAREAAIQMRTAGQGGVIINIASIAGLAVLKGIAPYATSKAAVIHMTKALALELARDGIRVNALAPGYFSTELNAEFLASEAGHRLMQRIPMRRFGELHNLDGPLLLLASDAGAFMTGSVLTVDGGHLLSA